MNRRKLKVFVGAALAASFFLAGCRRQQAAATLPAPEVAVVTVQPQSVVLTTKLPGRTASYRIAEIRPQVNGLLQKRLFTEGSNVKAGQVLYQIDPAPFQAADDSAQANLLAAQRSADRARAALGVSIAGVKRQAATVALAKLNRERLENLYKKESISAKDRDQAVTDADVAQASLRAAEAQVESDKSAVAVSEAAIKQAQAALETARINLGYTRITAPISGRIGRSNVAEGAIVTAYQPAALATIQEFDPIYVDVPQSTVELNQLKRSHQAGRLLRNGTDLKTVKLVLEDGTAYAQEGTLEFHDVTVDPTTGSVILRIVVPNPQGVLLPNMFVWAVIEEGVEPEAFLVPQQAVSRDTKGNPTVLVVDGEDKVQPRVIRTDRAIGDQWLVSSGLARGDRVVVEGVQKVRPGAPVKVVPFQTIPAAGTKPAVATQPAQKRVDGGL